MNCLDCPYIKNEYSAQDIEEMINTNNEVADITSCLWCEKVGGKIGYFGKCSDVDEKGE